MWQSAYLVNKLKKIKSEVGKQVDVDLLYKQFYYPLVLWADTILKDMDQAEDVVQDLFVRLWEKDICEVLEGEGIKSYLYTSVRNIALRRLKKNTKLESLPDISLIERVWEDPERTHQEVIDRVLSEIEKLPPRSREVLECVHLKNMKYAEVAEYLGISVSTVKTLLVRSIKILRRQIPDTLLLLFLLHYQKK